MKVFAVLFLWIFFLYSKMALSLPIGFGINQGDIKYEAVRGPNFWVYHDSFARNEGLMIYNALEAAKPILESWFAVSRHRVLPVIVSTKTSNASFANLITDAIELQTLGMGHRDDFWHEYVHNTMYLHLYNILGPAGVMLHLLWMPAWAIEGIAEALSVSLGSDLTAGIERYQALTGAWPSFDRLHSLYGSSEHFLLGYATSGAFISWILHQKDANICYRSCCVNSTSTRCPGIFLLPLTL